MKSFLLYASEDAGLESRLAAAIDMVRAFGGHLTCLQATPFQSFVAMDPFGDVYAMSTLLEQVSKVEEAHRQRVSTRLAEEELDWTWIRCDGDPAQAIADRARLSDLIILSLPSPDLEADERASSILGDVLLATRSPILAVPAAGGERLDLSGRALVAWNGAAEAAYALRSALPMLARASAVRVVAVGGDQDGGVALEEAGRYLGRYDIPFELETRFGASGDAAEDLLRAAAEYGAGYVVLGGYGHSRLREAVLGGTTRHMIRHSWLPLLIAH